MLVKGAGNSYRYALYILIAGMIIGVMVHILISRALRGGSMPVDAVVFTTVLTLFIFLLFRIPAIWQGVDFTKNEAYLNPHQLDMRVLSNKMKVCA